MDVSTHGTGSRRLRGVVAAALLGLLAVLAVPSADGAPTAGTEVSPYAGTEVSPYAGADVATAVATGPAGNGGPAADGASAPGARSASAIDAEVAPEDQGIGRLAGDNRVATAVAVSARTFPTAETVLIARSDDYADALAGAPLAGAVRGPILLTPSGDLSSLTAAEVSRLDAGTAILLGGRAALSDEVASDLADLGLAVERIGGADRFATAALVADRLPPTDTVYVTEGSNPDPRRGWPDAVAVAGLAAATQRPILLTTRDRLPSATADALRSIEPDIATIVGGAAAVSDAVRAAIADTGPSVSRLAGDDRFLTSRAVADASIDAGLDPAGTWLVTGLNWPDSLVAGPAAARNGEVLLLTHGTTLDRSPSVRDWVLDHRDTISRLWLVGGAAAISEDVEDELLSILPITPGDKVLANLSDRSETPLVVEPRDDGLFARFSIPWDPAVGDDPHDQAWALLEDVAPLLDIGETEKNLHLGGVTGEEDGTLHLRFAQHDDRGIPVRGGEVNLHVSPTHLLGFNGHWTDLPDEPTEPTVGRANAEGAAIDAVASLDGGGPFVIRGTSSLELLDRALAGVDDDGARLAWRIRVVGESAGSTWEVHVDAVTSEVLRTLSEEETHGSGDPVDLDIHSVNGNSGRDTCWFFATVERFYDEDGPVDGYTPGGDTEADLADAVIDDVYGAYHGWGWHGLDNAQGLFKSEREIEVVLDVDHGALEPNAVFNNGCKHLTFSNGWFVDDVAAHEFTHGVDSYSSKLEYENQSGALDEHYADVMGAVIDPDDWLVGEDLPGGAIRDLSNPSRTGFGDPDHMNAADSPNGIGLLPAVANPVGGPGGNDNGWVHVNSGIPNKAFFLMVEGGTHGRVTVSGTLTLGQVGRLFAMTHIHDLSKWSQFDDARDATVSRAQWWAGSGTHGWTDRDVCTVINAYAAVGLGAVDADCDGRPDSGNDSDVDGTPDATDNCQNIRNVDQLDTDGDGTGDACDRDDDGDGVDDGQDNCRLDANPSQADTDGDGRGDVCDGGRDGDGIPDASDNCPTVGNRNQADMDNDGVGDACDPDRDGDGVANAQDNAPDTPNPSQTDVDGDGVGDVIDNCPGLNDPDQTDTDGDGQGNPCDADDDGDGREDLEDNCPLEPNPSQQDTDGNGIGTRCDLGEALRIRGDVEDTLRAEIVWQTFDRPARLPVLPCTSECPDWIGPDYGTRIVVDAPEQVDVRIVDRDGRVVATSSPPAPDGTRTLEFQVDPAFHHRTPGGTVNAYGGYELQLRGSDAVGFDAEVDITVTSG